MTTNSGTLARLPEPLGIIGGTGLYALDVLQDRRPLDVNTPYGETSAPPMTGTWNGHRVVFITRHGLDHGIPPHQVNYRANLWALGNAGVAGVLVVNCVGGIHPELTNGRWAVTRQVIDYTWGRESTFFRPGEVLRHVDMTEPFCPDLRALLLTMRESCDLYDGGVYGCCQGPRLETAAEIDRLERDGADMVGMTAMPEVALVRELDLPCAMLSLIVNRAAGRGEGTITLEGMKHYLKSGMVEMQRFLGELSSR